MAISFGIRIVNDDGDGVEGVRVSIFYSVTHHEDVSDSDGWVHFTRPDTMHDGVRGDVFLDGQQVAEQVWIEDSDTLSFTV